MHGKRSLVRVDVLGKDGRMGLDKEKCILFVVGAADSSSLLGIGARGSGSIRIKKRWQMFYVVDRIGR